ncbi:deazapurine DNA modification protein DpdA family protein [Kitasatospora cineracea]|uniref:DeoxyPurine in DNA protein A domain-containing protein n=1 Tax=Kitasatospora cineracea TaxID=88074 RepID=A0A3N4S2V9_9ACTN|nr:hypothetical protein [Kitasatospora cineracea]RPE34957.1 hypothetical protein EDD38_3300 [Kitasatospora cineracea]
MKFYLGTHMSNWLATAAVPLFISRNRLKNRKTFPRAAAPWALDSGGFTELMQHGRWTITPEQYATEVRRYQDEIGQLDWAAPMDWMCEPWVIAGGQHGPLTFAGTGLTIREHQRRTVDNLLHLRAIAPDLPFIPVLQGWALDDYQHCADLYTAAGINLATEPVVGLGSVCRRQATDEITQIVRHFADQGLRLHGFGVKTLGLAEYGADLTSADSMAWSMDARRHQPIPGHPHRNCANCPEWAMRWRSRILTRPLAPRQLDLFAAAAA